MTGGRVLLTGSTGLIGRHTIAPLLEKGFEVVSLSRGGAAREGVAAIACNLLDAADRQRALREARADHLVHLAWHDGAADRWTSAANLDWVAATIGLLRQFAATGGRRALLVGSCAEYDWSGPVLGEDTPLRPATVYGAAKAATAMACIAGAPALGLSLAWARPFFCYGPGEPQGRLLGDLIRGLGQGRPVECTDGLQERDFLHVADIGFALAAILSSPAEGAINVASGKAVAVRELILTLAGALGRTDLVRLGARQRPPADPACLVADVRRLGAMTGFVPRYDLTSGLAAVLAAEGLAS